MKKYQKIKYNPIHISMILGSLVACEPPDQTAPSVSVVDSFDKQEESEGEMENNNANSVQIEDIESSQDLYDSTGLAEVTDRMDTSYCDDVSEEYANVAGATSYFTGIYTAMGGSGQDIGVQEAWFGIEEWILIPNNTWKSIQSETCYVVWDTVAYRTDIETCLGCTFGMEVSGTINVEDTTCPKEIWNYAEYTSWQADYEIALVGDISMFYYKSGSFLGMGHANDAAFNFLTEAKCVWF